MRGIKNCATFIRSYKKMRLPTTFFTLALTAAKLEQLAADEIKVE